MIIGREGCPYSESAKKFVTEKIQPNMGGKVIYNSIPDDNKAKDEIKNSLHLSHQTTFPIVMMFWTGKHNTKKCCHLGGYSELESIWGGDHEFSKKVKGKLLRSI